MAAILNPFCKQKQHYIALVPAAGQGARMQAEKPKQYLILAGKPLLWHTLASLLNCDQLDEVLLVLSPDDLFFNEIAYHDLPHWEKVRIIRCGGASRAESVRNGLATLMVRPDTWILIHDAARPCLSKKLLHQLIDTAILDAVGAILALPVTDTVKQAKGAHIQATLPRDGLWLAQTPQMFRYDLLYQALQQASDMTDEASAVEALGLQPLLVLSSMTNLKVTYPEDLALAEVILSQRGAI